MGSLYADLALHQLLLANDLVSGVAHTVPIKWSQRTARRMIRNASDTLSDLIIPKRKCALCDDGSYQPSSLYKT